MGYFRMKLNAVQSFSFFLKRGNFYRRGTGDDIKLVRYRDNGIGVRHPNLGINRNLLQQFIVVIDCAKFGTPVLAVLRRHYASPHLIGNQLGSVTNSEYRCIFEPGGVYFGAPGSLTEQGLPDRITPFISGVISGTLLKGWISQYTLSSRTLRAIS